MKGKIVTDSLGFRLEVEIIFKKMPERGKHKTYEQNGTVPVGAIHKIFINPRLSGKELAEVAAHESYHLFYSIRNLITCTEEIEAETFGQIVARIVSASKTEPQKL